MRVASVAFALCGAFTASWRLPIVAADIPRACTGEHVQFPFCNTSLGLQDRVEDLLKRIPLEEKALLLTARASPKGNISSIGLPEYNWGANCVHGVQSTCGSRCATSFPNPVNLGAIFDPDAVYDMARVIGWELRALWLEGARENYEHGPHLGLDCWSPNININRDPRWGRNMETPSEDPLVNALYGVAYTRGLQEGPDERYLQAVVTLKHWIAYSYEHYAGVDRMEFDAIVSKYDFADTYFPAFRASVVQGNAKGIMCSYNSLNGVPTCSNDQLTGILREHLGFDGYITSDSGAIEAIFNRHHYTKTMCDAGLRAIKSGTDVNSGSVYSKCLLELIKKKQLDESVVDDALRRTLRLRFQLGLFDPIENQPYWHVPPTEVNKPEHQALSLKLTRQSLVLLQNYHNVLPLKKGSTVAVLGPHSVSREGLMGNYYGQICHGDYHELGCVMTPFEAIQKANGAAATTGEPGCGINDTSTAHFETAVKVAEAADAVVLFLGIDTSIEREPLDRETIALPNIQLELLKRVRRVGKPTVVVLFNGGIIGAEELVLYADSVVEAFYPGYYGAQAIADVLFGDYNPSGKLPVTMYRSNHVDSIQMKSMSMTEYPGRSYRYFKEVPVFSFGWGLSYTTFIFRHSTTSESSTGTTPLLVTPVMDTSIQVEVANTGSRAGEEVVFAFFRPLTIDATGPVTLLNQQLFSYQRIQLPAGARTTVNVDVKSETLALYDDAGNLTVFPGFYEILITNGVQQRLTFVVHLVGSRQIIRAFPTATRPVPVTQDTLETSAQVALA
ncbi:hypothetical protein Poli38472_002778 [Pythium oligandrum]|uniref:Fibronectin type III-like domain-containing protein n=1 Tax=Pythium oligandrum TaxID=41045 RepID=A0A8K1CKC4_PYTOL|nr:hypothetical protein Poli38472_002778 [Pythium oligandrum]|eukprot:TMW63837.1 hypothetical protein Poli38472_002778 [Pythium oligandrum]